MEVLGEWQNGFAHVWCVSLLGSYVRRLWYLVMLKLACTFATGDSSARWIAEKQGQILAIIDLYGFAFASFSPPLLLICCH